ncbi:hypothetical protein AB0C34_17315 [Nocardia sp. NPDC049220]|uniref:hypothetical protein n=1 Tax=Nocardia sp. NPDC049220 TaxID=3155273 RepID=UPI0033F68BE5
MPTRTQPAATAAPTATPTQRLDAIATLIHSCSAPDIDASYDLCAHGQPWPCPTTRAAWIARGLDSDQQIRTAIEAHSQRQTT